MAVYTAGINSRMGMSGNIPKERQKKAETFSSLLAGRTAEGLGAARAVQAEAKTEQTMEEYKRSVYEKLSKIPMHPSQNGILQSVFISEAAFQRMKEDPAYEKQIFSLLQRDFGSPMLPGHGVAFRIFEVGAELDDYKVTTFPREKQENFMEKTEGSFWENWLKRYKKFREEAELIYEKRFLGYRRREKRHVKKMQIKKLVASQELNETARARSEGKSQGRKAKYIEGVPASELLDCLG